MSVYNGSSVQTLNESSGGVVSSSFLMIQESDGRYHLAKIFEYIFDPVGVLTMVVPGMHSD